jgi:hypothetical protein
MTPETDSTTNTTPAKRKPAGWRDNDGPVGGSPLSPAAPATTRQTTLLGIFLIVVALILFYLLFKAWPPTPWPTEKVDGVVKNRATDVITFFARIPSLRFDVHTSLDERLFLLVIVAGALGSYIHASTSFADYVGNRKFTRSWLWWYILRPFIGVALALISYFVVRAGFLTGGAGDVNPYGVAALGALSGMFSKQATDKLEEVFTTIFRPAPGKGDAKRLDKLGAPTLSGIGPKEGPAAGGTEVTITGTSFVDKPSVTFGGTPATSVSFTNVTTVKATTPAHEPGTVEVVVTNPDGQEGSPPERFTYLANAVPLATGKDTSDGASGGGNGAAKNTVADNVDDIDGCSVDIVDETPDEDLPITEGGVA